MNYSDTLSIKKQGLKINSLLPKTGIVPVREEIIEGLRSPDKYISSKFFYNMLGSELYEQITTLEEYYPTRTEKSILKSIATPIISSCKGFDIIELGPGDPSKISLLFDAIDKEETVHYFPLDISESAIRNLTDSLLTSFPNLLIDAWVLDFSYQFGQIQRDNPALICFFGSTIGNFSRTEGQKFISQLAGDMKKGDRLLLGMDLVKEEDILHKAYNDKQGVTAAFNLNILSSVNEILESNFSENDFNHLAFYNREDDRIEMHLEAVNEIMLESPYLESGIKIQKGERIHTENSHKFSLTHIHEIGEVSGLSIKEIHTDQQDWFSLVEFEKSE